MSLPTLAPDYYAALSVSRYASADDIRKAFHRSAKASHPDLHPDDANAETRFKLVNEAYAVLSDPAERRAYDADNRFAGMHGVEWGVDGGATYAGAASRAAGWAAAGLPRRARVRPDDDEPQPSHRVAADPLDYEAWVRGHTTADHSKERFARAAAAANFAGFDSASRGRGENWQARRAAKAQARVIVTDAATGYREWAAGFRASRRASERLWPAMAVGWLVGAVALYQIARRERWGGTNGGDEASHRVPTGPLAWATATDGRHRSGASATALDGAGSETESGRR